MSDDPFRDAADPDIPHQMDQYVRDYLERGYTEAETVDSLANWQMLFPGGPTLGTRRLIEVRVRALVGSGPRRGLTRDAIVAKVRASGGDSTQEAIAEELRVSPRYLRRFGRWSSILDEAAEDRN